MVCIAFQDTTAIPLIFAQVLGSGSVTSADKHFQTNAVGYVLIYTVFVTVYKWSVAYGYALFRMLKPVYEHGNANLEVNYSLESSKEIGILGSPNTSFVPIVPVKKDWMWTIKKIMNPPIYATMVSIPLALIPYMKEYVFCGSGAVLTNNVFAALSTIGSTVSPLICILLGSKLSKGYPATATISK